MGVFSRTFKTLSSIASFSKSLKGKNKIKKEMQTNVQIYFLTLLEMIICLFMVQKSKFFFQNLVWVLKRSQEGYVMNLVFCS